MPDVQHIDGRALAERLRAQIRQDTKNLLIREGIVPGIAFILVGGDPASQIYVRAKQKAVKEAGMNSFIHVLSDQTSQQKLMDMIQTLNGRPDIHGILVQLPLPGHMNREEVIASINPEKDVDGLHPFNLGRLVLRQDTFVPCTPLGCLELIKSVRSDLAGLKATIVGASPLVGRPMQQLLLQESATVTQAHSKTTDLVDACSDADILVVATGRAGLIDARHVKDGAIVIDVGITRTDDCRIVGDVNFDDVTTTRNCAITPVPGGVGPMTITMLLANTLKAANKKHQ
tara:strand:- start:2236 stop:3096 length:861 start_codon:yes stop_codon:yes gene_type:complete